MHGFSGLLCEEGAFRAWMLSVPAEYWSARRLKTTEYLRFSGKDAVWLGALIHKSGVGSCRENGEAAGRSFGDYAFS